MSSTLDILTDAARELQIIGAADSSPSGEDIAVLLRVYNRLVGQWNTRRRFARFMRTQEFTFSTSQQSYSIGAAADTPDFTVSAGGAPERIEDAKLVLTSGSPDTEISLAVINIDQYPLINVPALSSTIPTTLYYQRTYPNGTLFPWPYPTVTSNKLRLYWWNQLLTVDIADIASTLSLPNGYEEALVMTVAEKAWKLFPRRASIDDIRREARAARADIQSLNVFPPKISSTDGIQEGSGFNWRTREFV